MAIRETTKVGGLAVEVRELTVAEVRDWLLKREIGAPVDPVYALALDDCSLEDIAMMTDRSADELAVEPSELADLVALCKRINPHFFRVRAALVSTARAAVEAARLAQSTAPAQPS